MTQTAVIQPAAPQPPPAGPPTTNTDKKQFSSHFEKAISGKKDQHKTRESMGEKSAAESFTATGHEYNAKEIEKDAKTGEKILTDALFAQGNPAGPSVFPFSSSNNFISSEEGALPFAGNPGQASKTSFPQGLAEKSFTSSPAEPAIAQHPVQKPATDTLLAQLQQLIDRSNEKGTVTISRAVNSMTSNGGGRSAFVVLPQQAANNNSGQIHIALSSDFSESNTESAAVMLSDGFKLPAEKSDQQLASLRQNTQQQYYEAKINLQSSGKDGKQDRQQGQDSGTPTPAVAGQTSTTSPITGDQTHTFSQSLGAVQESPALPLSEAARTVTLPSGTLVHEEDVLRQLVERFQIVRRPMDTTQINLKLHPAELGELKIDLTVKEGSIRANVVAQSQHAQEIIEKNMMKLRTVLEQHGFTLETITVTSKSDSTGDPNFFERHLFGRNDYTPQSGKGRNGAETAFSLEETILPPQPATTGVNVKI
jgi:flagellar hook-length control protein FliK